MRSQTPAQDAHVCASGDVPTGDGSCLADGRTQNVAPTSHAATTVVPTRSTDWYSPGQSRTVEVAGVEVTVRFVGRKGRRGRIAITAPAGAVFRDGQEPVARHPNGVAGDGQ